MGTALPRLQREVVLYWMTATRRLEDNFALDRAIEWARHLKRPLWILEALRCDYDWASERLHAPILQGMAEHRQRLQGTPIRGHFFVERRTGEGKGLLAAMAEHAAVVVADDSPGFFHPRMLASAGQQLDVVIEAVDSHGLLPFRQPGRSFTTAHSFRRHLQKCLPEFLGQLPRARPLAGLSLPPAPPIPSSILERWPEASEALLEARPSALARLPIDHSLGVVDVPVGPAAARRQLRSFLGRITDYGEGRERPDQAGSSGLSPALHFGHLGSQRVFAELMESEDWSPECLGDGRTGGRGGWWGTSPSAEAFLDQLVTWRELGANLCLHHPDHEQFCSLPAWAQRTLDDHRGDPREVHSLEALEEARSEDPLWNAAQNQLRTEGVIHNRMRMLWGKRVLEWTEAPEEAMETLFRLNDRYALDGRDPNSSCGIGWVLGRHDRAWGERPIFGKVRCMTSASAMRKPGTRAYLERYGVRG